jgi:hypothetical protein
MLRPTINIGITPRTAGCSATGVALVACSLQGSSPVILPNALIFLGLLTGSSVVFSTLVTSASQTTHQSNYIKACLVQANIKDEQYVPFYLPNTRQSQAKTAQLRKARLIRSKGSPNEESFCYLPVYQRLGNISLTSRHPASRR